MSKIGFVGALCVTCALFLGCERTVVDEQQDVIDAEAEAQKEVLEEQEDVRRAAEEGAQRIAEEQEDVAEAAADEAADDPQS